MTYMKLHNAIKKAGYPKGTYNMWEGSYSFAELAYNKQHGIVSYPAGITSYASIIVPNLNDLHRKLQAAGINSFIYTCPKGFADRMMQIGLSPETPHIKVGLE